MRRLVQLAVIALAIGIAVYTTINESGPVPEPERAASASSNDTRPFDFYVLALSWSPAFCASPDGRDADRQCGPGADFGFITHGLWPQFEDGWPSFCQ
ncbi:MAG: hypothetical protein KI785_04680 [Devosiaceae bacterium]|nr:hypothetical protein [Devosiaceae bacterium MH13]